MKKEWITPQAFVEEFTTNEYLSSCWGVKCDTAAANTWEKNNSILLRVPEHGPNGCGNVNHQYLQDSDGKKGFDKMFEIQTSGPDLPCTVFEDKNYTKKLDDLSSLKTGDHIYWTTTMKTGVISSTTWHHQGTIENALHGNPNKS